MKIRTLLRLGTALQAIGVALLAVAVAAETAVILPIAVILVCVGDEVTYRGRRRRDRLETRLEYMLSRRGPK